MLLISLSIKVKAWVFYSVPLALNQPMKMYEENGHQISTKICDITR